MYIPYLHEAVIRELTMSEGSDSSLRSCKDQFGLRFFAKMLQSAGSYQVFHGAVRTRLARLRIQKWETSSTTYFDSVAVFKVTCAQNVYSEPIILAKPDQLTDLVKSN